MKALWIFSLLLASGSAFAAQDFTCPVEGQTRTLDQMYSPMALENVWGSHGRDRSPIVFVNEEHELSDGNGDLTPIGGTFLRNGKVDFRGSFKIGYNYKAKECRRQIVLHQEDAPGVWSGYTAIEICNPQIAGIFKKANAKTFDGVYKVLLGVAAQAEDAAKNLETQIEDKGGVCENNGTNYDQAKCDASWSKVYALYDQASSLRRLEISNNNKDIVSYFKDENGIVLPRFKVKLESFSYERVMANSIVNGQNQKVKTCAMKIKHGSSYAGLAGSYKWDFNYEVPYKGSTWTYDKKGQSKSAGKHENDLSDINFKDINEDFKN